MTDDGSQKAAVRVDVVGQWVKDPSMESSIR